MLVMHVQNALPDGFAVIMAGAHDVAERVKGAAIKEEQDFPRASQLAGGDGQIPPNHVEADIVGGKAVAGA